jgi:hypothetical protein
MAQPPLAAHRVPQPDKSSAHSEPTKGSKHPGKHRRAKQGKNLAHVMARSFQADRSVDVLLRGASSERLIASCRSVLEGAAAKLSEIKPERPTGASW